MLLSGDDGGETPFSSTVTCGRSGPRVELVLTRRPDESAACSCLLVMGVLGRGFVEDEGDDLAAATLGVVDRLAIVVACFDDVEGPDVVAGCLDVVAGCLDVVAGCLDVVVGCLDVVADCLDDLGGLEDVAGCLDDDLAGFEATAVLMNGFVLATTCLEDDFGAAEEVTDLVEEYGSGDEVAADTRVSSVDEPLAGLVGAEDTCETEACLPVLDGVD